MLSNNFIVFTLNNRHPLLQTLLANGYLKYIDRTQLPPASIDSDSHIIVVDIIDGKLSVLRWGIPEMKAISVDFNVIEKTHRYLPHQLQSELLVKAVGLNKKPSVSVLDATAGLGSDAFLLHCAGANITMLETHPIVYAMLEDGCQRFNLEHSSMTLHFTNAVDYMTNRQGEKDEVREAEDVVYLDPMFPDKTKHSLVKREMQVMQLLHKHNTFDNTSQLFNAAMMYAKNRVVIKRPVKSAFVDNHKPNFSLKGKAIRFDVYLT